MASEWFVEVEGKATGPFSVKQLKLQVKAGLIHGETKVRRGRGKWYLAKNVKGLVSGAAEKSGTPAKANQDKNSVSAPKAAPQQPATASPEGTFLAPVRTRKIRGAILGCLVALVMIGTTPIWQKLFFSLSMALILGSYPLVEVKKKTIEQTLIIGFFPVHKKKWRMRDFVGVMASTEKRITETIGCLVLLFFWFWFLFRLFDHLMPWMGGDYKLSLRQYDNEELLIWQGNSAADFEANLALFEAHGLPIE